MNWINFFGLIIVLLMLIPNMIYYKKNSSFSNKCKSKVMNTLEQLGRYGSMLWMVAPFGEKELGFHSKVEFTAWLIVMPILVLMYLILWGIYFKKTSFILSMSLAIIPSIIFISQGYFLRHGALLLFGVLFAVGHNYVTYINAKEIK